NVILGPAEPSLRPIAIAFERRSSHQETKRSIDSTPKTQRKFKSASAPSLTSRAETAKNMRRGEANALASQKRQEMGSIASIRKSNGPACFVGLIQASSSASGTRPTHT